MPNHPWQPGARRAVWSSWVDGECYGPGDWFPPGATEYQQFLVRVPWDIADRIGDHPIDGLHPLPAAITGDIDLSAKYYYYTPAFRNLPYSWCENVTITFRVGTPLADRYAAIKALVLKIEDAKIKGTSVSLATGTIGP